MKTKFYRLFIVLALLALSTLNPQLSTAFAQGTAFTYQGRLINGTNAASGTYNLTFSLFNTNAGGVAIAGPVTNSAVVITNGLFMVTMDFSSGVWNGQTNWLQIGVETNGGASFITLTPRQQLTPTPYAIYAESADDLSGTLSASQLTSIGNTYSLAGGNFFVGPSGNSTTSGAENTANGYQALLDNTNDYNTAIGYQALSKNNNTLNTAIGTEALVNITSGGGNIALGNYAGGALTGNESGNIDIGNDGVAGDNSIIRIGYVQTACYLAGTIYANGTFVSSSDRNAKENFKSVDTRDVLEKVAAMPVSRWNYKQDTRSEHIGPMAQDFYAAFKVGPDEKHITTIDEGGVALAAIQGLNEKVEVRSQKSESRSSKRKTRS
jgi:hypothetical protein